MKKLSLLVAVISSCYLTTVTASYEARIERASLIQHFFGSSNLGNMDSRVKLRLLILCDHPFGLDAFYLKGSTPDVLHDTLENRIDHIFNAISKAYDDYRVQLRDPGADHVQSLWQIRSALEEDFQVCFTGCDGKQSLSPLDIFNKLITPEKISYYDSIDSTYTEPGSTRKLSLQAWLLMTIIIDKNNYFSSLDPASLVVPKQLEKVLGFPEYRVGRQGLVEQPTASVADGGKAQATKENFYQEAQQGYAVSTPCAIL